MQRCEFCGAELPLHARFCGACGRTLNPDIDWPTFPSSPSGADLRSLPWPDQINSQSSSPTMNAEQEGFDVTVRSVEPENEPTKYSSHSEHRETDERRAVLPDLLLPGLANKQTPPLNVPAVQGTPQPGSVPMVQGTPAPPNTPPVSQAAFQNAAPSSAAPAHTPSFASQIQPPHQIRGVVHPQPPHHP